MTQKMTVALRPARLSDYEFARRLQHETMRPLAEEYLEWEQDQQDARFATKFVLDEVRIITLDGRDVGWLQLQETAGEIMLKQLFVTPEFQGRGIGSRIMSNLLDDARAKRKAMTLRVLKNSRAREFYERMGFSVEGESGIKFIMTWNGAKSL